MSRVGVLKTFASPPSGPGVNGTMIADIETCESHASALQRPVNVTGTVKDTRQPHGIGALGDGLERLSCISPN